MLIERLFQFLFWSALVFAFIMASLPQPPSLPGNPSDKAQHILAFLVLSGLAAVAFPRLRLVVIFLGLAAFGGAIEAVQAIPALGRQTSWIDWLADIAAIAVVLLLAGVFRLLGRKERAKT
jgi:VanZ family protein